MVIFEGESIWNVLYDRPVGTILIVVVILTFIGSIIPRKKKKKT